MVDEDRTQEQKKHVLLVELGIDQWSCEIITKLRRNNAFEIFGTGSTNPVDVQLFKNFLVRGNPHESGIDVTDDNISHTVDKHLYQEIRSLKAQRSACLIELMDLGCGNVMIFQNVEIISLEKRHFGRIT